MKSTRNRKPANREPKSLAITPPIRTRIPPSSPDQLQQVIDPQILELDAQQPIKLAQPDDLPDETQRVSWSTSPSYNSPIDGSQPLIEDLQHLEEEGKVFAWTFELEELIFNELVR